MKIEKDQKQLLLEIVEEILLNKKELESLKVLINELSKGKIDSKQLKVAIIKSRANALKRILHIFPFFHKRIINQQEINKFALNDEPISPKITQELEEKNRFLEQIGIRINKIVSSLKQ
jgi:hypothetical protein